MLCVYWAMPLHFCLRSDARLSLTKSIQRELYHLLPQKSIRKLANVCLGKDSKQGSRADQRPYFQLLLWGRILDQLRFLRPHHPLYETREPMGWCQSKVSKCQQLRPVSSQSCQRNPDKNPSSHPAVERPSHLPPGMMLHLYQLAINYLPSAGRLKHCISNWVVISKHPCVLKTVQGFHLDLVSTPPQLSIPLTVPRTKENMVLIDLAIQKVQMQEKEAIHVVPRESYTKGLGVQFF